MFPYLYIEKTQCRVFFLIRGNPKIFQEKGFGVDTYLMVKIIKEADAANLRIGKEYGLVAYNDETVLEVVKDGITSISIDFGLMGEKAAKFVSTKKKIQEYLPTKLIRRKSI